MSDALFSNYFEDLFLLSLSLSVHLGKLISKLLLFTGLPAVRLMAAVVCEIESSTTVLCVPIAVSDSDHISLSRCQHMPPRRPYSARRTGGISEFLSATKPLFH